MQRALLCCALCLLLLVSVVTCLEVIPESDYYDHHHYNHKVDTLIEETPLTDLSNVTHPSLPPTLPSFPLVIARAINRAGPERRVILLCTLYTSLLNPSPSRSLFPHSIASASASVCAERIDRLLGSVLRSRSCSSLLAGFRNISLSDSASLLTSF